MYPIPRRMDSRGRTAFEPLGESCHRWRMADGPQNPNLFDRMLLRRRRDRAAVRFRDHAFLVDEVAERIADRLDDVNRDFPLALDLSSHDGRFAAICGRRGGIAELVRTDLSAEFARAGCGMAVVADEEALPFGRGSFDLVVSVLGLHWVNDLPGALVQLRLALKPDGLFLGAMLGGATLFELREALVEAEAEICGGASPRISPFADAADASALLQRAGFALPVVDCDRITVSYPNLFALMAELRGMGETNTLVARRRRPVGRTLFLRAAEIYRDRYGDADGRVPATFDVIYLTGWCPHESQQQPLARGSAARRLAEALTSTEHAIDD